MKAFTSWSGGKDCLYAMCKFLKENGNDVEYLVNMCSEDGEHSRSHGITKNMIKAQADCIGIQIIQEPAGLKEYEKSFKSVIANIKEEGVDTGVFGDIYLEEHRVWIERVCDEMGIKPVFPLWGADTKELIEEFVADGFKTVVCAVNNSKLDESWLGRTIDNEFLSDIAKLEGIDPCAENGEYHSFVYDGPIFRKPVPFTFGERKSDEKNSFLTLELD